MSALATVLRCAVLLLAGLAWAAQAQPVTVTDDRGQTRRFAAPPQRIVTLLPSLAESVCALGACNRLVGVDRYANWPPEVTRLPRLGGLDDTQIERLAALRPDVVLAARSARVVDRLEGLGIPVLVFDSDSHAQVRSSLLTLAVLLGTPERGPALWQAITAQVQDAAARVPPALRGQRVYFEIGSAPYAAGRNSFIGQTLQALALRNIAGPELGAFPKLNPEFVVRAQPDVIIAPQRELQAMAARPGWSGLRALQQQRSCGLSAEDYELLIRPGPRLGEGALLLADCLQRLHATR
jgi:iron complex transport system substrate-binding protein